MDQTFAQLARLLLGSIPTIIIFLLLHFYLKGVLYRPLRRVLAARHERIEGRQAAASALVARAEQKLAGYEEALRHRQLANYKQIEAQRQKALAEGQSALAAARHQSAQALVEARQALAAQSSEVRAHLQGAAAALADQIMAQVLAPVLQRRSAGNPGVGA
ncbi:MAG: hypothetical protein ACRD01_14700 [Terriglobales bacterium]